MLEFLIIKKFLFSSVFYFVLDSFWGYLNKRENDLWVDSI